MTILCYIMVYNVMIISKYRYTPIPTHKNQALLPDLTRMEQQHPPCGGYGLAEASFSYIGTSSVGGILSVIVARS
eukprot:1158502-Pelagomonas_calceolata.AAC.11